MQNEDYNKSQVSEWDNKVSNVDLHIILFLIKWLYKNTIKSSKMNTNACLFLVGIFHKYYNYIHYFVTKTTIATNIKQMFFTKQVCLNNFKRVTIEMS